jgi:hypothetical protein
MSQGCVSRESKISVTAISVVLPGLFGALSVCDLLGCDVVSKVFTQCQRKTVRCVKKPTDHKMKPPP